MEVDEMRNRALTALQDEMSENTLKHIQEIEYLKDWIVDAMINFHQNEIKHFLSEPQDTLEDFNEDEFYEYENDEYEKQVADVFISRCKRKFRPYEDLKIKSSGGLLDLFDNGIKQVYRINDDEYDYLAENLTDGEMSYFLHDELSFGEKKECLRIVQNHLSDFYASS